MNSFDHPGLLYRATSEYLAGTLAFVRSALAADRPVLVAVPPANLELIRRGLGWDAGRVELVDMTQAGRNPGRIIPAVLLEFANRHPGRRASIIGEPVWPGRSGIEYPACAAHDALINAAFAGRDASILCPYDAAGLPPEAVSDAYRTHPVIVQNGERVPSLAYGDPVVTAASFNWPLPDPPGHAIRLAYHAPIDLATVRRFVADRATTAGLAADRATALAAAVNELAANTILHAGGDGEVVFWSEPPIVVCQVNDCGHLADPLAGRIPPSANQSRGRGLVLVNQLCDLVRIHTRPGRTSIRVHAGVD